MKRKINGSEAFYISSGALAVSATSGGYVLQYSTDGVTWTDYKQGDEVVTIPAGENLFASNAIVGSWFRLYGNTDNDVLIIC